MAATLSIIVADSNPHSVTLILRVKDEGGILAIDVRDIAGMPVPIPDHVPGDCPVVPIAVNLGALWRMSLPLTVTVVSCAEDGDETTTVFEGVGAPGRPSDPIGPGCCCRVLQCFAKTIRRVQARKVKLGLSAIAWLRCVSC